MGTDRHVWMAGGLVIGVAVGLSGCQGGGMKGDRAEADRIIGHYLASGDTDANAAARPAVLEKMYGRWVVSLDETSVENYVLTEKGHEEFRQRMLDKYGGSPFEFELTATHYRFVRGDVLAAARQVKARTTTYEVVEAEGNVVTIRLPSKVEQSFEWRRGRLLMSVPDSGFRFVLVPAPAVIR